MDMIKEILKWSIILCVAALLFYLIFPKYHFMGPKGFAFYRCNTITGEVMAWDIIGKKWVIPDRDTTSHFLLLAD